MAAPAHLFLPAQWKPEAETPGESADCAFSAESACVEAPLTSEPPLPGAEPLTSEPPLADVVPLTGDLDPVPVRFGPAE
ncbi:hypothetical protein ACGFYT_09570 [Streptomyces sp. NPDC048208]|uniref:hypothetical protein n=1 Tax=unclassified Streptomyces TaxID=2593676 RepID=UPI0013690959|nr:hypothetical protein [Streptomyces sp. SID4982]